MLKNRGTFHLTDLQKAYYTGMSLPCGMVTKAYFMYECKSPHFSDDRFIASVSELAKTHPMLRCRILDSNYQRIESDIEVTTDILTYEQWHLPSDIDEVYQVAEEIYQKSFIADEFPLFKSVVLHLADGKTIVIFYSNGLIMDGWSYEILSRDLEQIYCGNTVVCDSNFGEYVDYLRARKTTPDYLEAEQFWTALSKTMPEPPKVPLLRDPKDVAAANTYIIYRAIPPHVYAQLTEAAADCGVTAFVMLLTLFGKTLSLYSENHRFLLSLPAAVRPPTIEGINDAIGLYADALLFDFDDDENCSIKDLASSCQMKLMEIQDYTAISAEEILRMIQKNTGEIAQTPIVFTSTLGISSGTGSVFKKLRTRTQTSQIWIEALLMQCGDTLQFSMTCIEELISRDIAESMADVFIEAIMEAGSGDTSLFSRTALNPCKRDLAFIEKMNDTDDDEIFPSLAELYEKNFRNYSDRLAVGCLDYSLTYADLSKQVGSLLYVLRNQYGLKSGQDRIGILLKKGCNQVVCAITALCGNIAYMPIEAELPADSIRYCIEKANLALIITEPYFVDRLKFGGIDCYLDIEMVDLDSELSDTEFAYAEPDDISVIINTSGTTGKPKSICVYQKSLGNCFTHTKRLFDIADNDRAISVTSFCHDLAVFDILGMLAYGGAVIVPDDSKQKDPEHWNALIDKYQVTVWNSVPAFMEMEVISESLKKLASEHLKRIILGGDWVRPGLAATIADCFPQAKLITIGGPTETTIWNIYHNVTPDDFDAPAIPYGRSFPNTQYYILNEHRALCPIGVTGTMHVAGLSLASEYAGMPEETSKKFFMWNGQRVYDTGDLGLYMADATIQIRGRGDFQVKINGKRIELAGIQKLISDFDGIKSSIVLVNNHTHKLTAYYTAEKELPAAEIQSYLEDKLPDYMIPAMYIWLSEIPLTRNAKVDRKALADIMPQDSGTHEASDDALVTELLQYCRDILRDETISEDTNFYLMGGDSINALKVISKIKQVYSVEFSIADILNNPVLYEWADIIRSKQSENEHQIQVAREAVANICRDVFGDGSNLKVCLLDFEDVISNAEKISQRLSEVCGKSILRYDVISCPFSEDWILWVAGL
jgi:amino acid adenylation domain-containing protein